MAGGIRKYLSSTYKTRETRNSEDAREYYMLTAMFGVKVYKAYLEWCEEAKDILQKGKTNG